MGDSTCLARSFSATTDTSCVAQEGNLMRVLGESISFGRYMSENLDWEKWSTFSHNRHVEEAEKYSKPGSVAAKKAYFEAHYKKKAAEKAAALIEEANAQANGTFDSEIQEGNCTDSFSVMKSNGNSIVISSAQPDKDAIDYQVVDYADTSQYKCDLGQNDLDISKVEGARDVPHPDVDTNLIVESCTMVDNSNQCDDVEVHKNIAIPVEERMHDPGTAGQKVLTLPLKGRDVNSSPKVPTKTRASKLSHSLNESKVAAASLLPRIGINKKSVAESVENRRLTAQSLDKSINLPSGAGEKSKTAASSVQSRNGINSVSKSKKPVGGSVEKRPTARSLYMSINLPSGSGETSKAAVAAVKPRNGINHASKSMKSAGESLEKRQTARSLHMSINLPSGTGETSKTSSISEHNRIKKICSNLANISKDHPMASQASTKAYQGFSNQASDNPPSQGRRTERLLNKSLSGGVTANAKLSTSVDCLKSSSITIGSQQFPTISSPFKFRCQERAAKRKEFFQRMDEIKNKEEEKVQLQRTFKEKTEHDQRKLRQSSGSKPKLNGDRHDGSHSPSSQIRKEKTEDDHRKLRQSSGSKPKLNGDRHDGSHSPSNQIRKISFTQPRSPKLGMKTSSRTVQEKNSGNSWKPPISTNNSKRITEKINRTRRQPVTSSSNITRENDSPNIPTLRP